MPITLADIENDDIYLEAKDTLAHRIDFAWSVYTDGSLDNIEKAEKFLIYAFDIKNPCNISGQLIALMEERQKHQAANPEYIPGQSPKTILISPGKLILNKTRYGVTDDPEIASALKHQVLLDVTEYAKTRPTQFLDAKTRAKHRVLISGGMFKQNGKPFDTSMISDMKPKYASYNLNANGELFVFGPRDRINHTSINAGAPVVAAGELKIKNGVLIGISTYCSSRDYLPSLLTIYRMLEHLSQKGVDISHASVYTKKDPSLSSNGLLNCTSSAKSFGGSPGISYKTPANQIYKKIDNLFEQNIISIHQQVKTYNQGGFFSQLYNTLNSDLSEERASLAEELEGKLALFKIGIREQMSFKELDQKISCLDDIITHYQQRNNDLSKQYDKLESTGRLAKTMVKLKDQLADLQMVIAQVGKGEEEHHVSLKKWS
jgi:hypothetical protein